MTLTEIVSKYQDLSEIFNASRFLSNFDEELSKIISQGKLSEFLSAKCLEFFDDVLTNNFLALQQVQKILYSIELRDEFDSLCKSIMVIDDIHQTQAPANYVLLEYCLENFLFDVSYIQYTHTLEDLNGFQLLFVDVDHYTKSEDVFDFSNDLFGYLSFQNTHRYQITNLEVFAASRRSDEVWCEDDKFFSKKIEDLISMNECLYYLPFEQEDKQTLYEILQQNLVSRKIFNLLRNNNLLDQYDFETLKELLTKDEEKKKIKLNF